MIAVIAKSKKGKVVTVSERGGDDEDGFDDDFDDDDVDDYMSDFDDEDDFDDEEE